MNSPINDVPYYSPACKQPAPSNELFNIFEVWLQGQINTCVAGHASRISHLENLIQEQAAALKRAAEPIVNQDDELNVLRARVEDLSRALNVQGENLRKFNEEVDYDDIWYELQDRVKECVTDTFDDNFDDAVKEIIKDLDFTVSVS